MKIVSEQSIRKVRVELPNLFGIGNLSCFWQFSSLFWLLILFTRFLLTEMGNNFLLVNLAHMWYVIRL